METGSKIDKLVIGARDLKDHLGRYLIQGLVVSVFLHSAVMALVGLWPSDQVAEQRTGDSTIVMFTPPPRPYQPNNPAPETPISRTELRKKEFVPDIADPVFADTGKIKEEFPPLVGTVDSDAPFDSNAIWGGSTGEFDSSAETAGFSDPWKIFVPREVDPVPLRDVNPQPEYPKMAKTAGIDGLVHVWLHVDKEGKVIAWQIVNVQPTGLGFEDAVARVVPKWKFTPAIQQNYPVAVWVHIPIRFRMSN